MQLQLGKVDMNYNERHKLYYVDINAHLEFTQRQIMPQIGV